MLRICSVEGCDRNHNANYKPIYLGRFKNFEEAVKIRKEAELKYIGEIINR